MMRALKPPYADASRSTGGLLTVPLLGMVFVLASVLASAQAAANTRLDTSSVHQVVEDFLRRETVGLPGQVSFAVGQIDSRLNLTACPSLETFVAPGARLWGHSSVGVRCNGQTPWIVYVPVTIKVAASYFVTARPLGQGQVVTHDDLVPRNGDLTQLPAGIVTDARLAVGKTLANSIAAGQPMRQDMLRAPVVIQQGQTVKLVTRGSGFQVSAEGRAINNAMEGQLAQVRLGSGQVISGVARPSGVVEVTY